MTRTVREALLAVVLMCGIVTLVTGQQTGAQPKPEQEIEEVGAPDDEELQQLIAQAEALAGGESPASGEAIALITEELEALKAALAQKASLLEAGEDTADADLEIATRFEGLQAAIDGTTDPDPANEPEPMVETTSPERGSLTKKIDAYVGEALGLLSKIQELLAVRRDEAAEVESVERAEADPSEEVLEEVTGVVTESGEPVEGVSVTDPESGTTAVTDAEGQYTLEGLPAGRSAHLVLSKSGTQIGEGKIDLAAGRGGVGDFDVKPSGAGARSSLRVLPYVAVVRGAKTTNVPKGNIRGTLRDADGRPVPRALVSLGRLARARTNSRGQYAFLKVPQGTHELKVSKPGFPVRTERVRVTATRVDATMSLKPKAVAKPVEAKPLVRAGSGVQMRGTITSAAGPIRAAKVTLIRSRKAVSVQSGARGEFRLRDLEAGRYRVLVSKAGYQSVAATVSLESGAGELHRYLLKKTAVRVSGASRKPVSAVVLVGRVLDAKTRRPIAGAVVSAGARRVATNASGLFKVPDLRPGVLRVVITAGGYQTANGTVTLRATDRKAYAFRLTKAAAPARRK